MTKNNETGRSMIEMLGVLAIVGVLSVGGIAGYSKAMEKMKINRHLSHITEIVNAVQTTYISQKNYSGLNCQIAHDVGIIPDEMWNNEASDCYNEWGDNINVDGVHSVGHWGDYFYIQERDWSFSTADCVEIITKDWNVVKGKNSVVEICNDDGCFDWVSPVSIAEATSVCAKAIDNKELVLFFDVDITYGDWPEQIEECSLTNGGC